MRVDGPLVRDEPSIRRSDESASIPEVSIRPTGGQLAEDEDRPLDGATSAFHAVHPRAGTGNAITLTRGIPSHRCNSAVP